MFGIQFKKTDILLTSLWIILICRMLLHRCQRVFFGLRSNQEFRILPIKMNCKKIIIALTYQFYKDFHWYFIVN